jgi:hypothetical protein
MRKDMRRFAPHISDYRQEDHKLKSELNSELNT